MTVFHTRSSAETLELGASFAKSLSPGDVVAISGNLGAGKTLFVSGVCKGLGITGAVTSPTFTMIHEYAAPSCVVVHIDLYRVSSLHELRSLGVEEYFDDGHICLIEWAERAMELLPESHIRVKISGGESPVQRQISIERVTAEALPDGGQS